MKMLNKQITTVLLFSCFAALNCNKLCTDQLVRGTIQIVDATGEGVQIEDLSIVNKRTGIPICESIEDEDRKSACIREIKNTELTPESGYYVIVTSLNIETDLDEGDLSNGDIIEVSGSYKGISFQENYKVIADDCNLIRIEGNTTVTISED